MNVGLNGPVTRLDGWTHPRERWWGERERNGDGEEENAREIDGEERGKKREWWQRERERDGKREEREKGKREMGERTRKNTGRGEIMCGKEMGRERKRESGKRGRERDVENRESKKEIEKREGKSAKVGRTVFSYSLFLFSYLWTRPYVPPHE